MITKSIKLSSSHLAPRTRQLLRDCASGSVHDYDVIADSGELVFTLPTDKYPHVTGDLLDCMNKAFAEQADVIVFGDAQPVDPGLKTYPDGKEDAQ